MESQHFIENADEAQTPYTRNECWKDHTKFRFVGISRVKNFSVQTKIHLRFHINKQILVSN